MASSNREFRKIPSLNFLYEVSEDGRSFRNVKSKKEKKILIDYQYSEKGHRYTFVTIKGRMQRVSIAKVVAETFNKLNVEGIGQKSPNVKQHVILIDKEGKETHFESKTSAAVALAKEYDTSIEHMRSKLKKKRSHVYGYDIRYD